MKTDKTVELEKSIYHATNKQGVFGCFEVTIGWFGDERVDYMTYDTNGIWRCYEIKVSKADFHSKAKLTFIGNFNYYVLPYELYQEIKDEVPDNIGVWSGGSYVKRAKRQGLKVDEQILKNSMIRSLAREFQDKMRNNDPDLIKSYKREIERVKREMREYRDEYIDVRNELYELKHPEMSVASQVTADA